MPPNKNVLFVAFSHAFVVVVVCVTCVDDVWFCVISVYDLYCQLCQYEWEECVNKSRASGFYYSSEELDCRSKVRQFGHLVGLRDIVNLVNSFHFSIFVLYVVPLL